jgi:histidinol-phosphate aminotransferase
MSKREQGVVCLEDGSTDRVCRPEVRDLPPYNAGLTSAAVRSRFNLSRIVRLCSNEAPEEPSPQALLAAVKSALNAASYPDPQCVALREALVGHTGLPAERIVIGNGSENLIEVICLAMLSTGDRVVTLDPPFDLHELYPRMMGATVYKVPVSEQLGFDRSGWISALTEEARMVLFSNPSNPVGCVLSEEDLSAIVEAAPANSIIVVDEAYFEYAVGGGYADSLRVLGSQTRPWIVLRTFSKAYGLAGLRVGYGLVSSLAIAKVLDSVRTPFNVNAVAQAAAMYALKDQAHVSCAVKAVRTERERVAQELRRLGLRVAPSGANFLFFDSGRQSRDVAEGLLRQGIIVKPWRAPGYEHFIRVTIGAPGDNDAFLAALGVILEGRAK